MLWKNFLISIDEIVLIWSDQRQKKLTSILIFQMWKSKKKKNKMLKYQEQLAALYDRMINVIQKNKNL